MRCPFCEAKDTKVIDSRLLKEGLSVRRRRKCDECNRRFTTYETIEIQMPMVVKLDGRREEFKRDKIRSGVEKACQKRPVPTEQIERIVDNIEKKVLDVTDKEINSKDIGNFVMQFLRNLDPVAYIRFASVYRKFQDVEEFVHEIKMDESNLFHQ
jgi:transcriptional repressor NrdR